MHEWEATITDDAARLRRRERLADAALFFSMVMIFVWWEGVFVETVAGAGRTSPRFTHLAHGEAVAKHSCRPALSASNTDALRPG
jgi:hypothetical protein